MRVIAGALRGRGLVAPRGRGTRPTTDRVRESLFGVLGASVEGAAVLDLFAGSGALGIEALSRGAASLVAVERAPAAIRALRRNLATLELTEATVIVGPVERSQARIAAAGPFDLVFVDPPYDRGAKVGAALAPWIASVLAPEARLVFEHDRRDPTPVLTGLDLVETRRYGDTALSFYVLAAADEAVPI